jgi:hypothetical protein
VALSLVVWLTLEGVDCLGSVSGWTVAGRLRERVSSSGVTGGLAETGTAAALGVDLIAEGFITCLRFGTFHVLPRYYLLKHSSKTTAGGAQGWKSVPIHVAPAIRICNTLQLAFASQLIPLHGRSTTVHMRSKLYRNFVIMLGSRPLHPRVFSTILKSKLNTKV